MISVHTSRWAELSKGNLTNFIFPKTISVSPDGIQTVEARSLLFPWIKEEELMAFTRVASIRHMKGLMWDTVIVDVLGSANTLDVKGLRKPEAKRLVEAIHRNLGQIQLGEVSRLAKIHRKRKEAHARQAEEAEVEVD